MIERDHFVSRLERFDFNAEGSPVARVRAQVAGDRGARLDGDAAVLAGVERNGGIVRKGLAGTAKNSRADLRHHGARFNEGRAARLFAQRLREIRVQCECAAAIGKSVAVAGFKIALGRSTLGVD